MEGVKRKGERGAAETLGVRGGKTQQGRKKTRGVRGAEGEK